MSVLFEDAVEAREGGAVTVAAVVRDGRDGRGWDGVGMGFGWLWSD